VAKDVDINPGSFDGSRESVQEIKLVLTPVDTQAPPGPGGKLRAPLIEGAAVPGED